MPPQPDALTIALAAAAGYLLGSVPSGLFASRIADGGDIREFGSGGTGATNVWRVHGRGLAAVVFAADVAKGALAAGVAGLVAGPWAASAAACGAVVGHVAPVWARFRGGKGVATAAGAAALLAPWSAGAALFVFGVGAVATRRVSVGSLAAAVTLAVSAPARSAPPGATFCVVAALTVILAHGANVRRLLRGEEPRLGRHGAGQRRSGVAGPDGR